MSRKMLINAANPEECRMVVVADGLLQELDIQINTRESTLANIYKGAVTRVEPSLQAAFVDYGASRNGFLSISDVHPSYFPESFERARKRPRIEDVFKKNDHVIVQVAKEERDNKGASLTTAISLAGRYMVLMPGTELHGISRKIGDEKEREKLREIVKQLKLPDDIGLIIRTAGKGRSKTELTRDLNYLLRLWKSIENMVGEVDAPALLYREQDVVIRSIRDHFDPNISEILVDDKAVYDKAREFMRQVMPRHEKLVKLCQEKRPLFNKYQLEEQIEQVYQRRIRLKSGGYLIIQPTEAMVTIDVNSGGATKERGIESTAFNVNMEAATEAARQLRLRDLGGIIVIDFIDMINKKHKQDVEKQLKAGLKDDRAKSKVLRISPLGLLELSRQRLKSSLGTGEFLECPMCEGEGKVRSPETMAVSVFRKIKSLAVKKDVVQVRATVPSRVAEYLLNRMRSQIVELEQNHGVEVKIVTRQVLPDYDSTVEALRPEPVETVAAEAEIAAHPGGDVAESADREDQAETEKKKPKKSSRRRRRSKKKAPSAEARETAVEQQETAATEAEEEAASFDEPPAEEAAAAEREKEEAVDADEAATADSTASTQTDSDALEQEAASDTSEEDTQTESSEDESQERRSSDHFSLKRHLPFA